MKQHTCIFDTSEHKNSRGCSSFIDLGLKKLERADEHKYLSVSRSNEEILKDHFQDTNKKQQPRAGYFIGCRWFEKEKNTFLRVSPKIKQIDNKIFVADYMKMFSECLKDPVVSATIMKNPDKLYKIFFDEPSIEIPDVKNEITPFLILHFLQLVKNITKKGLKKGYIKVTENLTSKIKGKILVNQTIKQNHFRNRLEKTVCNYQIFTINCIENQIIKTALMQCSKHLNGIQNNNISKMLRQNITAFELVDSKEVFDSDFSKIKHSPFYKEYKEALKLSQMIFKRFGFSLNSTSSSTTVNKIPPYYINMPELFERYVEVKLREQYPDLIDGNKEAVAMWGMKPDFLLPSKKMIIDAKYKYWFEGGKSGQNKENSEYKADYMQLSLYGRDLKVRSTLGLESDDIDSEIDLLFIYPIFDNINSLDLDKASDEVDMIDSHKFNRVKRLGLHIPNKCEER